MKIKYEYLVLHYMVIIKMIIGTSYGDKKDGKQKMIRVEIYFNNCVCNLYNNLFAQHMHQIRYYFIENINTDNILATISINEKNVLS